MEYSRWINMNNSAFPVLVLWFLKDYILYSVQCTYHTLNCKFYCTLKTVYCTVNYILYCTVKTEYFTVNNILYVL